MLGDVMLDRYVTGSVERISPEAPVPVVLVEREWDAVGGAANVAANVCALGARCDVIGVVGGDDTGRTISRTLEGLGTGCHFVPDGRRATTVKTRVMAQGQQVVRIDREDCAALSPAVEEALTARVDALLPGAHVLVMADYDKGVLSPVVIGHALDTASTLGIPVVVDPKRRNFFAYRGATVFKPNRSEVEAALGESAHPEDADWMEAARARAGCEHLLLTLGSGGMALASPGGVLKRIRARARTVYDVSGAGDTVSAVVAVSVGAGAALGEAARLAAHAAAVGVGKVGVATVTPEEIAGSLDLSAPR